MAKKVTVKKSNAGSKKAVASKKVKPVKKTASKTANKSAVNLKAKAKDLKAKKESIAKKVKKETVSKKLKQVKKVNAPASKAKVAVKKSETKVNAKTVKTDKIKKVVSKVKTDKVKKVVLKKDLKDLKKEKNLKVEKEVVKKPLKTAKKPVSKGGSKHDVSKKQSESSAKVVPVEGTTKPKKILNGKSVDHIKGYSKEDLDNFRKIILDKREEILEQLQNLQEQMYDPSTGEYINENSPYSLHMAEQGTDAMEREKTFLYAQRENKFLGYLDEALKRIDNGTYGICVECIDNPQGLCPTCPLIPKPRLEAVPHSQLCVEIKKKQERPR